MAPVRPKLKLNAVRLIRRMVIENPEIPLKQIIEDLGDDRPTDFVVETIAMHTRETVREMIRMGKLNSES